jgi:hypothetical protein
VLGPTPVGTDWRVIDTAHFSFNVRPDGVVSQSVGRLTEVLDDQYEVTVRTLDLRYAGRISLFLYESGGDGGFETNRAGTAYPDTEAVRAAAGPPVDGSLFVLLSHEMNHVIQQNSLGRPGTSFLNEGLPSAVLSERYHSFGKTFLYAWTARNDAQIPSLATLVDDDLWDTHNFQVKYNASASFLAYLLETNGAERLKQLYQVSSKDFEARFQATYGRSLADAERDWRAFCASRR